MTRLKCSGCKQLFEPTVVGDLIQIMCNDCTVVWVLTEDAA